MSNVYNPEALTPASNDLSDLEKNAGTSIIEGPVLTKIQTSECGRYVKLGSHHYDKEEFTKALLPYGGDFRVGTYSQPERKFGNPAPLGLASFSICVFTLSLINARARDVTSPSVLVGAFIFVSGLLEILAGMWCLIVENTFGGTVFSCFGGFWCSYAFILIKPLALADAYATTKEFENAIGLYLMAWAIFAFLCWILTFKSTWAFCALFFFVWTFVLCLAVGALIQSPGWNQAGGILGVLCSIMGFYNMFGGMSDQENSYFTVKPFFMPGAVVA
ncbi:hypothetical protein BABINDRAFT_162370 [Babjeviella inositovora NRRL Y-12698]|uniref:Uncharacterized protein n=1 Tax=Babjeviella inositovora NRRL Y-12698 TaxID=984486 RepID=A0A1E3QLV1_9ASCO|nr:uncharacterized protein BABINDRAFT_162370 [Babjeviella inositovora NRRL Y-12698]ODQ78665.1 hypothetical protein BABINDRAFT_162370 [Babjeviella inositovora NRRL Y-12698]